MRAVFFHSTGICNRKDKLNNFYSRYRVQFLLEYCIQSLSVKILFSEFSKDYFICESRRCWCNVNNSGQTVVSRLCVKMFLNKTRQNHSLNVVPLEDARTLSLGLKRFFPELTSSSLRKQSQLRMPQTQKCYQDKVGLLSPRDWLIDSHFMETVIFRNSN